MPNVMGGSGRTSFGAGHGDRMSAGRAAGGGRTSGGSSGRQQVYKDPHYGLETSYGAPIKTGAYGVGVAQSPERWKSWKDQVGTYNKAARDWNDDRIFNTVVNKLLPFGLENTPPDLNRPKTYTDGTYHTGWNPAAAAGSLLGMALPGAGVPGSIVAGNLYSAFGGPNVMLGGGPVPAGWDPRGAQAADTSSQGNSVMGGQNMAGGNTGNGGQQLQNLAQINQPVSGNPGAPQAVGPTPSAPTPQPNYQQIMASLQQITPGYGVQLPGYKYGKATV